jgi:hypothetical protein
VARSRQGEPVGPVAVARLSERLGIPVGALRGYGARGQTRTDHLRDVAAYLGWRQVDRPRWKDLEEFLFARAMEHDSPKLLFRQACEYGPTGPASRSTVDLGRALPPRRDRGLCRRARGWLREVCRSTLGGHLQRGRAGRQ